MITERHVVACFLASRGRVLLLKRSNQVATYQGRWAGVSGSVRDEPLVQAMREVHEETGLLPQDLHLVRRGGAIEVVDQVKQMRWQVHPFLFRVDEPEAIQLSWEHVEYRWVDPRQIDQFHTVPMLEEALARVWDTGELGPVTGVIRSQEFEPAHRYRPATMPPLDRGLEPAGAPLPPGFVDASPSPSPVPSPTSGAFDPMAATAGSIDPSPLEDELRDELEADEEAEEEPPPRPVGIRVKVLRATGEFAIPDLNAVEAVREAPPPGRTGAELLEDPLLTSALSAIRGERLHNSTLLVRRALDALQLAGERSGAATAEAWIDDLRRVGQALAQVRPSLAALGHHVAQVLYELEAEHDRRGGLETLRPQLARHIARLQEQEQATIGQLADEVARLIPPGGTVMTLSHCTTVVEGLQRCRHFGIRVIIPEGRPSNEGRLTARAVLAMGKSATVIVDGAVGMHMREADLVLMGAESLLVDGSVVNRTGADPMALAAKACQVPLYVAAPLTRLDLRPDAVAHLTLEEKEPAEVWDEDIAGLDVRNVYYEQVPRDLITGLVTEDGLLEPSSLEWEVRARDHLLDALRGRPLRSA